MKLREDIVLFEYAGIPMIGNFGNGCTIGLTSGGLSLCNRMQETEVPDAEVYRLEPELAECLVSADFIQNSKPGTDKCRLASAYLHVTQRCNLSCLGCYSDGSKRNVLKDASTQDMKSIVAELAHAGVENLVVSGGEPLLRNDLGAILKHAKECGIGTISILTNGLLVNKETVLELAPYTDCISVSFDGCSSTSPAYIRRSQRFGELVKAIEAIRNAGIEAHIIATIHGKNADDVPAYEALAEKLHATLNFSMFSCRPSSEELASLIPSETCLHTLGFQTFANPHSPSVRVTDFPIGPSLSVKKNCGAGVRTISIDADGAIYPCHMLHDERFKMGNAITGTVGDALQSDIAMQFLALDATKFEDCKECSYVYLCGGGCRARSYFYTNNTLSKDPYCAMTISFYDALARTLAEAFCH